MINTATLPRDQLNSFTHLIANGRVIKTGRWVKLRNGTLVRPVFKAAEDETCEDAFFAENYKYCWNLDGTSVTRRDYDMMEIVQK